MAGYMSLVIETAKNLQGFLVPLIAIITTYIAVQQARISRAQYRFNLFEKRYAVYKATREFLQDVIKNAKIVDASAEKRWHFGEEAEFLFSSHRKLVAFLKDLHSNSLKMMYLREKLAASDAGGLPPGEERSLAAQEMRDLSLWFVQQRAEMTNKFSPSLKCGR